MSIAEQLLRTSGMRKVGRKHRHTLGPGSHKPDKHAKNVRETKNRSARKLKNEVAEYWTGKRDEYPKKRF